MSNVSYLNLKRGNTIGHNLGLVMSKGYEYTLPLVTGGNAQSVEIPLGKIVNTSTAEFQETGLRQQYLELIPACSLAIRGHNRAEFEPNPELFQYGIVQVQRYMESGESGSPSVYILLRRDLTAEILAELDYLVRIYLRV